MTYYTCLGCESGTARSRQRRDESTCVPRRLILKVLSPLPDPRLTFRIDEKSERLVLLLCSPSQRTQVLSRQSSILFPPFNKTKVPQLHRRSSYRNPPQRFLNCTHQVNHSSLPSRQYQKQNNSRIITTPVRPNPPNLISSLPGSQLESHDSPSCNSAR